MSSPMCIKIQEYILAFQFQPSNTGFSLAFPLSLLVTPFLRAKNVALFIHLRYTYFFSF